MNAYADALNGNALLHTKDENFIKTSLADDIQQQEQAAELLLFQYIQAAASFSDIPLDIPAKLATFVGKATDPQVLNILKATKPLTGTAEDVLHICELSKVLNNFISTELSDKLYGIEKDDNPWISVSVEEGSPDEIFARHNESLWRSSGTVPSNRKEYTSLSTDKSSTERANEGEKPLSRKLRLFLIILLAAMATLAAKELGIVPEKAASLLPSFFSKKQQSKGSQSLDAMSAPGVPAGVRGKAVLTPEQEAFVQDAAPAKNIEQRAK